MDFTFVGSEIHYTQYSKLAYTILTQVLMLREVVVLATAHTMTSYSI